MTCDKGEAPRLVEHRPLRDIFKFKTHPYVMLGSACSGKTNLCCEILKEFGPECNDNNIHYLTGYMDDHPPYLNPVPKKYRVKGTLENLINIWTNIRNSRDEFDNYDNKSLLIIDELNCIYNDSERSKRKIAYNGELCYSNNVFKRTMNDILIAGRHFNVLICIAAYDISLVNDKLIIGDLIFMSNNVVTKYVMSRRNPDDLRHELEGIAEHVFKNEPRHTFIGLDTINNKFYTGRCELKGNDPVNKFKELVSRLKSENGILRSENSVLKRKIQDIEALISEAMI